MSSQSNNIQQLLLDAAVEIAVLDGTENAVFRRLMAELQNQSVPFSAAELGALQSPSVGAKPPRKFATSDSEVPVRRANENKQSG
jgi:hypothetical protein